MPRVGVAGAQLVQLTVWVEGASSQENCKVSSKQQSQSHSLDRIYGWVVLPLAKSLLPRSVS